MQFQIISVCYRSLRTCFEIRLGKRYAKIPAEYNLSTSQVPIEKITHCQIWQQSQMPSLTYSLPNAPIVVSFFPKHQRQTCLTTCLALARKSGWHRDIRCPTMYMAVSVLMAQPCLSLKKKKAMFTLEAYNNKMSQPQKQTLH